MALADNLIAYWPMDEASGNIIDAHDVYDLTESAGDSIGSASGIIGTARDWEAGDTEHASYADGSPFDLLDTIWSFAGWLNYESFTSFGRVFSKNGDSDFSNKSYELFNDGIDSNKFTWRVYPDGSTAVDAVWATGPSTGTWYFVAMGHNSTANDIWISVNAGTPVTTSHSGGVFNGSAEFRFGNRGNNSLYYDGLAQFWGVWGRDIRSDLATLYNSGTPLTYSDLTGGGGGFIAFPYPRGVRGGLSVLMGGLV